MAITNGTCVSFCNQPKAHYLATSRESRRYVVAVRLRRLQIWLRQESPKAHFGLPWVRPWVNLGKCYMDRKRIQCWSTLVKRLAAYTNLSSTISEI